MDDTKYGLLAAISLLGMLLSLFGSLSDMIGVGMIVVSNGLAVFVAGRQKCVKQNHKPVEMDEENPL